MRVNKWVLAALLAVVAVALYASIIWKMGGGPS